MTGSEVRPNAVLAEGALTIGAAVNSPVKQHPSAAGIIAPDFKGLVVRDHASGKVPKLLALSLRPLIPLRIMGLNRAAQIAPVAKVFMFALGHASTARAAFV